MKLPAIAIAALFAGGIAIGLHPGISPYTISPGSLMALFLLAASFVAGGGVFLKFGRLSPAAAASSLSWVVLGTLGSAIALQPRPANHVLELISSGKLDVGSALRWHGSLRDEPARLPWGYGLELDLSNVEYDGSTLSLQGGLRISFAPRSGPLQLPDLHAGDKISVLTRAKLPQMYKDDGAFNRRAYLAGQNVDLVAALRSPELLEKTTEAPPTWHNRLARIRRNLRDELDTLFAADPRISGVLRAMLLGDRSFVDRAESVDFQKTGVFHVLVVAGLHVGAIAFVLFWVARKLHLPQIYTMVLTVALLFSYVAVIEQRPPVLRAAIMTTVVVLGGFYFRRLELLNSAAVAALLLLVARPLLLRDSSFQLTFVAIGCIAGIALPAIDTTLQPFVRALRGWRDVTRDAAHEPRIAQFRIDFRSLARLISTLTPIRLGTITEHALAGTLSLTLRICEMLVVTIVLQLGMLPLMVRDFHRVSFSAPLTNLFAVPLMGITVPLGFITLVCNSFFPALGKLCAMPLGWLAFLLVHIVHWFAHFTSWSYRVPAPPLWLASVFFLALIVLAIALRSTNWSPRITRGCSAALLATVLLIAVHPFAPRWQKGKLELNLLDVGQGDAIFLVSPAGKTMLIDGGGSFGGFPGHEELNGVDPGEEAVSPYLWSRGFQKLDVLALTHAHQDHLGGLTSILDNFKVGELWIGREVSSPALAKLEAFAAEKKIPIVHQFRGQAFAWDGVDAEFLWPNDPQNQPQVSPKNNDSLVLRLHYRNRTFLLPGDAEKQAEREILSQNAEATMQADVLKIGHHGSNNSTTPEFLSAVKPQLALISSGEDNPYGHPSPELLERLRAAEIRILRTDHEGVIHVLTDGEHIEVTCFVPCDLPPDGRGSKLAESPNPQQQ